MDGTTRGPIKPTRCATERIVIQQQVSGKKVHDARLVASMKVHGITDILTFNNADFSRYPGITIIEPEKLSPIEK